MWQLTMKLKQWRANKNKQKSKKYNIKDAYIQTYTYAHVHTYISIEKYQQRNVPKAKKKNVKK